LVSVDTSGVTFTYKDYRIEGPERYKTIMLEPGEFIRRFLMHVLPKGFHRIRHYGLLAVAAPHTPRRSPALASSSPRHPKSLHRPSHHMMKEAARTQRPRTSSTIPARTVAPAW
jgi:hypothetical protein